MINLLYNSKYTVIDKKPIHVQVTTKAADRECRGGGSKAGNRKRFRKENKRAKAK